MGMEIDWVNVRRVMDAHGARVVAEMRTRLQGHGKEASGRLIRSLGYEIVEREGEIELVFVGADYAVYVDKGRRPGRMPPLENIRDWCRLRNIPVAAAYPIARKIGLEGIRPTNFASISMLRNRKRYDGQVEEAAATDVAEALTALINENLGKQ